MNIILFGPPGSGKGTQAENICHEYDFFHLSTGDIIRSQIHKKTALGKKAKKLFKEGKLLDDETILTMVEEKIDHKNIVFDGFPRTIEQAKAFDKMTNIDLVIFLKVSDEEVVRRISQRWMVEKNNKQYTFTSKEHAQHFVEFRGGEIFHREDDTPDVIRTRIAEYDKLTNPILDYYGKKVHIVDGELIVNTVWENIQKILNKKGIK